MINWVEVSRGALRNNLEQLRRRIGSNCKIMAVVKANAYGHGLVEVGKCLVKAGTAQLAVVNAQEAMELRQSGIEVPILTLGYVEGEDRENLIKSNVRMCLYNLEIAKQLNEIAIKIGKQAKVDIEIETGMNRLGFMGGELGGVLGELKGMKGVKIEGAYSHFANEESPKYCEKQLVAMNEALTIWKKSGLKLPIVHMNKSKTVLKYPKANFNMVRVGGLLYGLIYGQSEFKTVMKYKSKIVNIKSVKAGEYVGYRGAFQTKRATKVGVVASGYADGYGRAMSNRGQVSVNGEICPVIGQICMNQTLIDVTDTRGVQIDDEVVLFGDDKVNAFMMAEAMGTISYEITSRIPSNIPRIFID